jgi:signal transduction histidine kinase
MAVKETLHNIIKHSGADEVWLRLKFTTEVVTLTIEDNGKGFASDQKTSMGADGLVNLKQRLAGIGGACEQASQLGKGTATKFIVKLTGSEN